jgi:hypothetical protein
MVNSRDVAASLAAFLLVYHQVTTCVPLFPWNDVQWYTRKELLLEASFNGVMMGVGLACILGGNSGFTHWYPLYYYPFLIFGECMDWWFPYFSDSFARVRGLDYETKFSRTLKLIPHKAGKRTPDANHILLHLLTLVTTVAVYCNRLKLLQ